jgi:hypothetical protein
MTYNAGIADWSGSHLNFVQYLVTELLSAKLPLSSGGSTAALNQGVHAGWLQFQQQRQVLWDLLEVAYAGPDAAAADEARWLLRELPFPKTAADVDWRVNPAFVMSPFPSAPWKNDWTMNDRSQALDSMPTWAISTSDYMYKDGPIENYRMFNTVPLDYPGTDYLLAYWYGRKIGAIAPTD